MQQALGIDALPTRSLSAEQQARAAEYLLDGSSNIKRINALLTAGARLLKSPASLAEPAVVRMRIELALLAGVSSDVYEVLPRQHGLALAKAVAETLRGADGTVLWPSGLDDVGEPALVRQCQFRLC